MSEPTYFDEIEDENSDTESDSESSDDSGEDDDNISIQSGVQSGGVEDLMKDDDDEIIDEEEDEESENEEDENPEDLQDEADLDVEGKKKNKKIKQLPLNIEYNEDDDDDNENSAGESYLKKFDKEINQNYIMDFHPECILKNYDEIECLSKVVRDKDGIIVDELHRTIPYLTKYERTRILGQRAKQIDAGATSFVKVPENVIEGYLIAILELEQKRIPFIIRRPLPNGGSEYWNVKDLENISF
jgi:DNA-directed RNA polymerase I, II, and III subunit RPABC2